MEEIALPIGFKYSGVVSGLRSEPGRLDVGAIVADWPCAAAGVFTQNRVSAAPVQVSRERLPRKDARAIICCSGNANACTGEQGLRDAERMAALVAETLGCAAEQVLVASTGVIGRPLPMPLLEAAIPTALKSTRMKGYADFAASILTTDTKTKIMSVSIHDGIRKISFLGIAKGAAMIGPNMATMLGFLATDGDFAAEELHAILQAAVAKSFNRIAVEGHTSTNDCVFALASGAMKMTADERSRGREAIEHLCNCLAGMIVADAEGANHVIELRVTGCRSEVEAEAIARCVASSALVKTAVFGHDPNWGRVVSAAGYAGVPFEERDLSLKMGEIMLYEKGTPLAFDAAEASRYLKEYRHVVFELQFTLGNGACTFHTCDLTTEYVKLNADYTT